MTKELHHFRKVGISLSVLLFTFILVFANHGRNHLKSVSAAVYTQQGEIIEVNTTEDELNNDGDCSIREAVAAVNNTTDVDHCIGSTGVNSIYIPEGVYLISIPSVFLLEVDMSIIGAGEDLSIIDGNSITSIFYNDNSVVEIQDLTISKGGNIESGAGINNSGGILSIINCSILDNHASSYANGYGAGIYNSGDLTIVDSLVANNSIDAHSAYGGGIFNYPPGTILIVNTIFRGNEVNGNYADGGALFLGGGGVEIIDSTVTTNSANGVYGFAGGGVFNMAPLTLRNSSIINNNASVGGGIYFHQNSASVINTTISNNRAGYRGSGIYHFNGTTYLQNSTVSNNLNKGAIYFASNGSFTVKNSIVSYNPSNCTGYNVASDGYNISDDTTCSYFGPNDQNNVDPMLGPLQDNGGLSFTHALQLGSPAIDTGDSVDCPVTDQRGYLRDSVCDRGSYEYGAQPPHTSSEEAIQVLISVVNDMELPSGIANSLSSKLENAIKILVDENEENDHAAEKQLNAFINAVEAQRGKKLTEAQADELIYAAQEIINSMEAQP